MRSYNPERQQLATSARTRVMRTCRLIAKIYQPIELPDCVINRVCSRRKLYNYLSALGLTKPMITAIFHQYNLPVPQDVSLKSVPEPKQEEKPDWLDRLYDPAYIPGIDDLDLDLANLF